MGNGLSTSWAPLQAGVSAFQSRAILDPDTSMVPLESILRTSQPRDLSNPPFFPSKPQSLCGKGIIAVKARIVHPIKNRLNWGASICVLGELILARADKLGRLFKCCCQKLQGRYRSMSRAP